MNHNVILDEYGCRMRPVTEDDSEFILRLRNSAHAKGFIGDSPSSVESQKEWFRRYYTRENDYYWILTEADTGRPVGTAGLYDIHQGVGVSGRWVMLPDANFLIVVPAMLNYQFAFERLGLDKIILNVVATNQKVLKFQRLIGARETHIEKNGQIINGVPVDFVWFEITKAEWPAIFKKWDVLLK